LTGRPDEGGTITVVPVGRQEIPNDTFDRIAEGVLESYSGTLKNLS
jgi:hypothetical protein